MDDLMVVCRDARSARRGGQHASLDRSQQTRSTSLAVYPTAPRCQFAGVDATFAMNHYHRSWSLREERNGRMAEWESPMPRRRFQCPRPCAQRDSPVLETQQHGPLLALLTMDNGQCRVKIPLAKSRVEPQTINRHHALRPNGKRCFIAIGTELRQALTFPHSCLVCRNGYKLRSRPLARLANSVESLFQSRIQAVDLQSRWDLIPCLASPITWSMVRSCWYVPKARLC